MLKSIAFLLVTLIIFGCAGKPQERGFSGTGEFDAKEAAKTRVSLGLTYLQNGNFSQAKFNLDKALEFAPRSGEANYAMAFYYEQVDERERAEEYFNNALGYSNDDPDILNSYGAFLCKQGKYERAKQNFLKAVDDKRYVSTAETYENLALCSQSQGKITEAIEYFNTALNHQPTRASTLLYLTEIYVDQAQWEDAKRSLFKYERNASINANSLWLSYQIAQGEQNMQAAQDYASLLLRLYPNHKFTVLANQSDAIWQPSKKITQKIKQREQAVSQEATINGQTNDLAKLDLSANEVSKPEVQSRNSNQKDGTVTAPQAQEFERTVSQTRLSKNPDNVQESSKQPATVIKTVESSEIAKTAPSITAVKKQKVKVDASNPNVAKKELSELNDQVDSRFYHVVLPKENLFQISRKYNVKMAKLVEWNNLSDASSIQIGSRLWIRDPNSNE